MVGFFSVHHYKAVLFRRWITVKRTWGATAISLFGTLFASALAIIINYLFILFLSPKAKVMSFNDFDSRSKDIIFFNSNYGLPPQLSFMALNKTVLQESLASIFQNDTGKKVHSYHFTNEEEMREWVISHQRSYSEPETIPMAVDFTNTIGIDPMTNQPSPTYQLSLYYNTSEFEEKSFEFEVEFHATRALHHYIYKDVDPNADLNMSFTILNSRYIEYLTAMVGPVLIGCGMVSIVPMIITQPIIDLTGEIRSYMISCSLSVLPYWLATFTLDFAIWILLTTVMWCIYLASQIQSFLDNIFTTWYVIVAAGPSFIVFMYCLSFLFNSVESANRQIFLVFALMLLVPFITEMIRQKANPIWLEWIFSLFPHLAIERLLALVLANMGPTKKSYSYYWLESKNAQPFLIMEVVNFVLYSFVLFLIERYRISLQNHNAKKSYGSYDVFFKEIKRKSDVTQEAIDMENEVKENSKKNDYAVRIEDASRLFFNTEGKPIPAVNCVTLGVKEGSLFGFLGANGAGKTTLIRMITSLLPPSNGTIEIFGKNIQENYDPNIISICPQFNKHLINEMTIDEHFKLFGMLFRMSKEDIKEKSDHLIKSLELENIRAKPLSHLSQGDVRKLAIALSFYGPARIILLDEPTASLDPVARHNVQEMILENRKDKTFMLCTHLLSEAEFLCDMISIMVKGCVYTCGSPQQLTEKFGTDFKIDVMLNDDSDVTGEKCDEFFMKCLPKAVCSIMRPKARIYDVPASSIDLADLFKVMEEGKMGDNGFSYYTCSSSSLERVFMEIVKMSEEAENNH